MIRINNFTELPISKFTKSNTLFISKQISGFSYYFLVEFEKFEKGMIHGKILDIQPNNMKRIMINGTLYKIGDSISSRISKSYTTDDSNICHWFEKTDKDWKCK
jgi:hypothetical protein